MHLDLSQIRGYVLTLKVDKIAFLLKIFSKQNISKRVLLNAVLRRFVAGKLKCDREELPFG